MSSVPVKLVRPSVDFRDSFLRGYAELDNDDERDSWVYLGDRTRLRFPEQDFAGYVNEIVSRETHPAPHFVADTAYWAMLDQEIVGRISIRHFLNDFLKRIGGHIGYIVRPSYRGRGIATEMLRQILQTPRVKENRPRLVDLR
jgi:predicted acetyltransferase